MFDKCYERLDVIGRGKFGEVIKVKSRLFGEIYVMKKEISPAQDKSRRKEEIKALKLCNNKNIVKYIDDFYEKDFTMILMEYCPGGDLAKLIDKQKDEGTLFSESLVISFALDLASAMQYMKSMRIIHRDLKVWFKN